MTRIAILSTPKTGNVWMTSLLREAYGVPLQPIDPILRTLPVDVLESYGDDWIVYAHVYPDGRALDWLRTNGVHVLTTVRHPCDVLVSLRHFVTWNPDNESDPARAMLADGDAFGEASAGYVREHFANVLGISMSWSRLGALTVRYEDMIANPAHCLGRIAERVGPLPEATIRKAVLLSQFKRMRAGVDPNHGLQPWRARHFREGRAGGWREALGDGPVVETMRSREPFISLFQALGYGLDARTAEEVVPFAYADIDPFRGRDHFDNGVPISPWLLRIYLEHPDAERQWSDPVATGGPSSFFSWLNAPAAELDGARPGEVMLTNLAANVYGRRPDVQAAFPDLRSADRLAFAWWFLTYGVTEHRLAPEFTAPVQASLAQLAPRLPS